jgi:enoyl-CoA hydratase
MAEPVLTEVNDGIAVVTINRPEARNAVNGAVARGIAAAVDDLEARADVRVLVLTGAGGTFSAGMDLKGFLTGDAPIAAGRGFGGIVEKAPSKPVIAAVEGYALAGGFELVLACDLVVASETARFGLPEVRRGLVAGAGGLLRLPRRIPYHLAMEIALTGEHFPAQRLAEAGLVNAVVRCAAGAGRDQAGHRRVRRLGQRRGVRPPGRDHRPGVHDQGRDRGRGGLRREATARLARRIIIRNC